MRKFIISAVSVAALAATSVPALAQSWGNSLEARKANIDRRIEMGQRTGTLNYAEATRLRGEFRQIMRLEANYRRNGLTGWEYNDLNNRLQRLSAAIRFERRDRDYSYQPGYDNGYRSYDNGYRNYQNGYRY